MASADLRKLLDCSICLNVHTDPVSLRCGHSYCRTCIESVLDSQASSGAYFCPECRDAFKERPVPYKNLTLHNLVKDLRPSQKKQEKVVVFCTYCIDSAVAAVKSCLLCEASLCENHLRVHSKAPEHELSAVTNSPDKRKCPVHKKALEFYCRTEDICICASCQPLVEHRGHKVETLDQAAAQKKYHLTNVVLRYLMTKRDDTTKKIKSLQERRREAQEKANGATKRIKILVGDIRRQAEDLDKTVLSEVHKLEATMTQLLRKMRHFGELCATADSLTVLLDSESEDLCDPEDGQRGDGGDTDMTMISFTLSALSDITSEGKRRMYLAAPALISLDENSANNMLEISVDRKTVSRTATNQNHPQTSHRFTSHPQVMSSQRFSSGQHYWEAEVGGAASWRVGVAYPSFERSFQIGWNKSWCLERAADGQYSVVHNSIQTKLTDVILIHRVRVYVDFEAGQVSFYLLSHPIRHLHTFTSTFTEPLHAVLGIYADYGSIKL